MESLVVRFEQKRGHYLILERNPPLSHEELNETQFHMIKQCEIPGLLALETEEYDGQVSLRYALSGTRMLSEVMRTSTWSMTDMMGALCRLAEVLEECRLYLLDADRIRLQDEFIFVGDEWHDLKFIYLPIDMPTLHRADDLERLIIRWMMKVKEPEGQILQNVLKLVSAADFMPISLSRYARQYLAGTYNDVRVASRNIVAPSIPIRIADEVKPTVAKSSRSWDFLHPVSGDLHPVSEMWGDLPELRGDKSYAKGIHEEQANEVGASFDVNRWRIIILCVTVFLVAVVWKVLYLAELSKQKLLLCLCVTLILGSGVLILWNGMPNWMKRRRLPSIQPTSSEIDKSFQMDRNDNGTAPGQWAVPRFPSLPTESPPSTPSQYAMEDKLISYGMPGELGSPQVATETTWISTSNDQTAYLDHKQAPKAEAYCLVWKTKDAGYRIPLRGNSLVIGRSAEAAQHVDETMGISRAHVEFVRVSEQWKIKDLGSRNGSRLNDKPMAPYELYTLNTGDCLTIANSQYCFQQVE
ncbi:DUF6382 domain-containing protein [Cohnella sp. WQ 127256]|uniref:DUF6382 domain-containing protein n=1 Tax=Cohnella sp. WQ 127256 TaxID=2938790 RepID=UPI002118B11C|nr:DUF6382 domain-containing protein [Cohnella sp. WQ 127256]